MKKRIALIATLPKSGTWYSHTFFWCYDQLLCNADAFLSGSFKPDLVGALRDHKINSESSCPANLERLYICHSICPGFDQLNDIRDERWNTLRFPLPYNWGEPHIRGYNDWAKLDPSHNPAARIVYLYRNPLDHFVSYYHHAQEHKDDMHRIKTLRVGASLPIKNLHDFVFDFSALEAFVKQYYTFKQMHQHFPEHVMLIPYEHLTAKPNETFFKILSFIGAAPKGAIEQHLFNEALAMCSKDSLMSVEASLGRSLVGDLEGNAKHIRDGETGKWKNHFFYSEIEAIESAFNSFGMSLSDFELMNNTLPLSLLWVQGADIGCNRQLRKQIKLLEQQLIAITSKVNRLESSMYWYITAPVRIVMYLFEKILAKVYRRYLNKRRPTISTEKRESGFL